MRTRERWQARARIAAKKLGARVKQVLTTDGLAETPHAGIQAGARALAEEAARMRGGMAKVAQLAGYLEPWELGADARGALARLWSGLPPAAPDAIDAMVRAELGGAPEELFARWEPVPLAAASLGQVHAAWDDDGRALVVKVQYPGVAEALTADVSAHPLVRQLAGASLGDALDEASLETLRDAILGELDYRAEAAAMRAFRAAFAGDASIAIPAVDDTRSSARVLTMERMAGVAVTECTEPDAVTASILRFSLAGPLRHGLVHGDPNPGNYLADGSRVAFLDYGCTTRLDGESLAAERSLWRALLHSDPFESALRFRQQMHILGLVSAQGLHTDAYRGWEELVAAPFLARGEFRFTPGHAAALVDATQRLTASRLLALPPPMVLVWRQRLGVAAVLGLVGGSVDARAILAACT